MKMRIVRDRRKQLMLLDVIYSICFNICLLVVLRLHDVNGLCQRLLINEESDEEEGERERLAEALEKRCFSA